MKQIDSRKQWLWRTGFLLAMPGLVTTFASVIHSAELQRPDPGRKIKVFLFAGQSNMEGRADGGKLTREDRARLHEAQKRVQLAFNHQPIRPLNVVAPSDAIRKIYQRDQIFGPELFFGVTLAEAWPEEKFLFIKMAVGSTSLYGCWNPDWSEEKATIMGEAADRRLYHEFVEYVRQVLEGYSPHDYQICAMLWVQGESDGKVPKAESTYGSTLRRLVEQVRLDTRQERLPFLLFQVGSPRVVDGMKQCAAKVPKVTLIRQSQDPHSPDFYEKMGNGHYNDLGMKKLGARFAEVFLRTDAPSQRSESSQPEP